MEEIKPLFVLTVLGDAKDDDSRFIHLKLEELLAERQRGFRIAIMSAGNSKAGHQAMIWAHNNGFGFTFEPLVPQRSHCDVRQEMALLAQSDGVVVFYRGVFAWARLVGLARMIRCPVRVIRLPESGQPQTGPGSTKRG
jgi:hypothetical protein